MLDAIFVFLVSSGAIVALWDYGRRRIQSQALRHDKLLLRTLEMQKSIDAHCRRIGSHEEALATQADYVRSVLSGFINSATDIITISEEEKRQLRNKVTARAFTKQ